jgi:hypothetical protein
MDYFYIFFIFACVYKHSIMIMFTFHKQKKVALRIHVKIRHIKIFLTVLISQGNFFVFTSEDIYIIKPFDISTKN